ncbi:MAG TPA: methyltransferase [Gemmata sp.]|nr:methyltransferase [Gemmata sp.]
MNTDYVLGQSERAARRLEIQDQGFAETSELLLDELAVRPTDRVVELGCGPGGFSKRILKRLGPGGVLISVDSSQGLLDQASRSLAGVSEARFETVLADVSKPGKWLEGADVLLGRAVLHHVPMAEFLIGQIHPILKTGTRVGFIEPDFRSPLARLALLEATSRPELAPLHVWATVINELYLARRISPDVGATLGRTFELAGYRNVNSAWSECTTDSLVIENMVMFYDEVRDTLQSLGILNMDEVVEQQRLLRTLAVDSLPAVWGLFRVTAEV